ncbi:hypothetical protein JCM5353_004719 [Sporobolomyces roseus]
MNSAYDGWDQDLSDDEDDQLETYKYSKSSILFCIEATPSMLEPNLDFESSTAPATFPPPSATAPLPTQTQGDRKEVIAEIRKLGWNGKTAPKCKLEVVLMAAYAMMKRKVISSPKDQVGILVWNTDATDSSADAKLDNSICLFPPEPITTKNLRMLKELLECCEQDENYLAKKFAPSSGSPKIGDAFGHCSTLLVQTSLSAQMQVFWVTDNDDPVRGVTQLHKVALNKRRDLEDRKIDLQPFFVPPSPLQEFDLENFYGEVISLQDDEDACEWPTVHSSLEIALFSMIQNMKLKESSKRVAFKIPFQLADGFVIGIAGYNMVGEERKKLPSKVDVNNERGAEVLSETIYKDGESGVELKRGQIKKYFQVGKSDIKTGIQAAKIFFTDEEVRKVKALGKMPGLRLLGFLPKEGNLHFWQTVKQSYFVYPEEERWEGSTRTFAALLKSMVKKKLIAYGAFIGRRAGRPQIVILLPQEEKLNEAGVQELPPGFHLCQLPFADDIRALNIGKTLSCVQLDEDGDPVESQPAVEAAKKVIKNLTKSYKPDLYPNPSLSYHYECLAAMALFEDEMPVAVDMTLPAHESIDQRIGKPIEALRKILPPEEFDPSQIKTSKSVRPKKVAELGPPPDLSEFLDTLRDTHNGDLHKLKNDDLKRVLKSIGQKVSGKKDELVERIEEYLEEHDLVGKKKKKKVKEEDEMDLDEGEGEDSEEEERLVQAKKRRKKSASYESE